MGAKRIPEITRLQIIDKFKHGKNNTSTEIARSLGIKKTSVHTVIDNYIKFLKEES